MTYIGRRKMGAVPSKIAGGVGARERRELQVIKCCKVG